jgi:hypothetical protein
MPLLPAYYTTTNLRKRKAKKPSKSAIAHEEWLMAQGLHISQLKKARKVVNSVKDCAKDIKVDRPDYVSAGMSGTKYACAKRGVMTNLHKEPRHVQEAILAKAARTAPLYSKGPYQLITDGASLSEIGKKM